MNYEEKSKWVYDVELDLPSLEDNTADADRLSAGLKKALSAEKVSIDFSVLKNLPDILRKSNYKVRCIVFNNREEYCVLSVKPWDEQFFAAGLALDIGTTRISARLIDIYDNQTLTEISFDNPQIKIGPDILTRIHFARENSGLQELNTLLIDEINFKIREMCGILPADIYAVFAAGNTAMTHFFTGLDPQHIIREPYIPVINNLPVLKADKLKINVNPNARVFVFPNIGSYFGGDLTAGILYSGLNNSDETAILVDVGTNAEAAIGNKDWIIACAGAAGPALESGVSKIGTSARPGAIKKVKLDDKQGFIFETIEDKPAVGICGSGVIDLAACLFKSEMLDIRGKFAVQKCGGRLQSKDGMNYFTVVFENQSASGKELLISQADIDSLIRSKAAMYTVLETLSVAAGMKPEEFKTFYVAGAFGVFIDPQSAITIGMLPNLPTECYKTIGNSSLEGAAMALTANDILPQVDKIKEMITYLELNVNQDFMNRFSAAKFLPHTDISRFTCPAIA